MLKITILNVDEGLLSALRVHNPWLASPSDQKTRLREGLPVPFIPRSRTLDLLPGRAELVIGPRQAGKSTWIREMLSSNEDPVLILHAEEPSIRELSGSPARAIETLSGVLQANTILVLEEIQHLQEAPLFIKGLVDLDRRRRIAATGSSSFALRAQTRESLAGRVRRTRLLPFSIAEVGTVLDNNRAPAVHDDDLSRAWERIVVFGGYPEPWFEANPAESLRYLVEAFVLKDASDLHSVERPAVFRRLLELAAADIGNLVNLSEWAGVAQAARNTAARYLSIAEEAHIVRLVPPFVGGRRAEVTGTPKVFFIDNGLRNAVFGGFGRSINRGDRGALWENAVFGELLKRLRLLDEVRFWRSKNGAEVDFVVRRQNRLVAVEVKAGGLRQPKLTRAARSFIDAYEPRCFGVVNGSLRLDTTEGRTNVCFCRPWEINHVLNHLDG